MLHRTNNTTTSTSTMNTTPNASARLSLIPSRASSEIDILNAPRYTIRPMDDGTGRVLVQDDRDGPGFRAVSLDEARGFVRAARDAGCLPRAGVTFRRVLGARGGWCSWQHTLGVVHPWALPLDPEDLPARWDVKRWDIDATDRTVRDRDAAFLVVAYASGDDHIDRTNREALDAEDPTDALDWCGGSYVLRLDAEASFGILDALDRLESYCVLDEGAHAEAEHEEDAEAWQDYGQRDVLSEVADALGLTEDGGWTLDVGTNPEAEDINEALLSLAFERGRIVDGLDVEHVTREWIEGQGSPVQAVAALLAARVLRLYWTNPEVPVLDAVREVSALHEVRTPEDARAVLAGLPGMSDGDDAEDGGASLDAVAAALAIVATRAAGQGTPVLPGLSEDGAAR